jgi:hypothetical protein
MGKLKGVFKAVGKNEDKFAIIFSFIALVSSFSKTVVEFCLPANQLTMIVSEPNQGTSEENSFPISKDGDKFRLDPHLNISFISGSSNNILVKFIELQSPKLDGLGGKNADSCESDTTFNMQMDTFENSNGDEKKPPRSQSPPGKSYPSI